ncbi:RNA-binding protein 28-like isoform X3 [Papaver somniferum]|uniref:RNA-binding protein 28-like isoform X3 n=2 Tax=Papaver somniferum TaxID=3469 RepID=UPI000E7038AE|nr:RNA-binding protein 28-like isoform X3 [Papaver somniferum]
MLIRCSSIIPFRLQQLRKYLVMFFRFVTSGEIRRRSEFFKPFVLCLANTTVDEYCKTSLEPMGEESDNVQITALSDALGVPIRVMYLACRSYDPKGVSVYHYDFVPTVGAVPNTSKGDADSVKPFITLLYRLFPGHYDILYPKQSESPVNPERPGETTLAEHERMEEQSNLQRTVFIGNLPFRTDNEEVRKRFSDFREVLSYFPVLHEVTWRQTGTGYLKFSTPDEADAAVAAARYTGGSRILLNGRRLTVIKALDKKARDKELEKAKSDDVDQRNLELAKIGVILKGSRDAEGVSSSDMYHRQVLETRKNDKIQSSPDFHVSRTRLAVYNFPMILSEKQLKYIILDAILSPDCKQTRVIQQLEILGKSKHAKATEKGLKRGTAFVEFSDYEHALAALNALNNNAKPFGPGHRPIVEFAVENIQSPKRLREKLERLQTHAGTEFLPRPQ